MPVQILVQMHTPVFPQPNRRLATSGYSEKWVMPVAIIAACIGGVGTQDSFRQPSPKAKAKKVEWRAHEDLLSEHGMRDMTLGHASSLESGEVLRRWKNLVMSLYLCVCQEYSRHSPSPTVSSIVSPSRFSFPSAPLVIVAAGSRIRRSHGRQDGMSLPCHDPSVSTLGPRLACVVVVGTGRGHGPSIRANSCRLHAMHTNCRRVGGSAPARSIFFSREAMQEQHDVLFDHRPETRPQERPSPITQFRRHLLSSHARDAYPDGPDARRSLSPQSPWGRLASMLLLAVGHPRETPAGHAQCSYLLLAAAERSPIQGESAGRHGGGERLKVDINGRAPSTESKVTQMNGQQKARARSGNQDFAETRFVMIGGPDEKRGQRRREPGMDMVVVEELYHHGRPADSDSDSDSDSEILDSFSRHDALHRTDNLARSSKG
ncbi:hypothetical protein K402DRAFT_404814 [Aulographum hederae CBS 113979]|uniref:Uncharacterized protein n=1 Tax=Aulographum hederae CBS 113979 TaxID=1176131 RepID=A0A6G1GYM7_9PEZI|nr:hypothetical protein K402DRAFT_404814 [Aulographum hederae CBS 113979]